MQEIREIDEWLDSAVGGDYPDQPMAQDWARISKIGEELGEAIQNYIGYTGQNPRKGFINTREDVLEELADTAWTAIFAIQHFTKDVERTNVILASKLAKIHARVPKSD